MLIHVVLFSLIGQLCMSTRHVGHQHQEQHGKVQCDNGFHDIGNVCLRPYSKSLTYFNAHRVCKNHGARLLAGSRRTLLWKINQLRHKSSAVQGSYWTSGYSKNEYGALFKQYPRKSYGLAVTATGKTIDLKPRLRTMRLPFICEKPHKGNMWNRGHRQLIRKGWSNKKWKNIKNENSVNWKNKNKSSSKKKWKNKNKSLNKKKWKNKNKSLNKKKWKNKNKSSSKKKWKNKNKSLNKKKWKNKNKSSNKEKWRNKSKSQSSSKTKWKNKNKSKSSSNNKWKNKSKISSKKKWKNQGNNKGQNKWKNNKKGTKHSHRHSHSPVVHFIKLNSSATSFSTSKFLLYVSLGLAVLFIKHYC